jgi:hypothetical protein
MTWIAVADHIFMATLDENPTARELPVDIRIEDYSKNEKTAYLPCKLMEDGSGPFMNDALLLSPLGATSPCSMRAYRCSSGLISIGWIEDGVEPALTRGEFPLRVKNIS